MLWLALAIYLPMMASGVLLRPPGTLRIGAWEALAIGLGAAIAGGAAVIFLSRAVSRHTGWGRILHRFMHDALGSLGSREILWLSLLSAFGEEILFRGVLHPRLGLWVCALLFAGFHFPFQRILIPWTVFAFVMGLALGGLTDAFGSLWPAIVMHFMINHVNLHDLVTHELPGPDPPPEDES